MSGVSIELEGLRALMEEAKVRRKPVLYVSQHVHDILKQEQPGMFEGYDIRVTEGMVAAEAGQAPKVTVEYDYERPKRLRRTAQWKQRRFGR